jgi:hypothetical protein
VPMAVLSAAERSGTPSGLHSICEDLCSSVESPLYVKLWPVFLTTDLRRFLLVCWLWWSRDRDNNEVGDVITSFDHLRRRKLNARGQ